MRFHRQGGAEGGRASKGFEVIGSTIAFLASPAGGAIVGAFQNWLDNRRQDKRDAAQRDHERWMGQNEHSAKMYSMQIQEAQLKPLRYVKERRSKQFRHILWIWRYGKPLETFTRIEQDKLSQTARERMSGIAILMFASVYCVCCLWVALWIGFDFSIVDPDSKQAGFNLLGIIGVKWGGNKPIEQSGLSALMAMLATPLSIVSYWLVRRKLNK